MIGVNILNRMTELGMPESHAVRSWTSERAAQWPDPASLGAVQQRHAAPPAGRVPEPVWRRLHGSCARGTGHLSLW